MLYELIKSSLLKNNSIARFGKNKYYNTQKQEKVTENTISYFAYDAIEICLEFIGGKYYLSFLLTVYITDKDGNQVNKDVRKIITNKQISKIWNKSYNEKLMEWNRLMYSGNQTILFTHTEFDLKFNYASITYGNLTKTGNFPQKTACQFDEPIMAFNINDKEAQGINQLRGH
jgi:hypothetical protein